MDDFLKFLATIFIVIPFCAVVLALYAAIMWHLGNAMLGGFKNLFP